MDRAAEVVVLWILLHIWICIEGQTPLISHLALAFDLANYSSNFSSPPLSWLVRREGRGESGLREDVQLWFIDLPIRITEVGE